MQEAKKKKKKIWILLRQLTNAGTGVGHRKIQSSRSASSMQPVRRQPGLPKTFLKKRKKQPEESRFPLDSGRLNIELSVLRGQIVLKLGLGHGHKPSSPVWWLAHTFKSQHLVDRDRQISRVWGQSEFQDRQDYTERPCLESGGGGEASRLQIVETRRDTIRNCLGRVREMTQWLRAGCSCGEPRFNSQHLHGPSQL